jgi:hypothetical protein
MRTQALGPLESWGGEEEGCTASDHAVIWASWGSLEDGGRPREATVTGWRIDPLLEDEEAFRAAESTWRELSSANPRLTDDCSLGDIENEANWLEAALTKVLDKHAKQVKLCARSKRWWGPQTVEARTVYSRACRAYQAGEISEEDRREARRAYYTTIRRAKRECWEAFLQGTDEGSLLEQKRCWAALRYTKFMSSGTTLALIDPLSGDVIAATFKEKEAIFRDQAFPQAPEQAPSNNIQQIDLPGPGSAHELATEVTVGKALLSQGVEKAPGIDKLNFKGIRLLWRLDQARIIA